MAIDAIVWRGAPYVIARQLGAALGYSTDGARLPKLIRAEWAAEFAEGRDYLMLAGDDLRAFIRDWNSVRSRTEIDARAPALMLLTKRGAQLAAARSDGPEGIRCRAWLLDIAVPAWEGKSIGTDTARLRIAELNAQARLIEAQTAASRLTMRLDRATPVVVSPDADVDVPAMLTRGRRVPAVSDTYSFHCTACDSETRIKDGTPEQIAALQRDFDEFVFGFVGGAFGREYFAATNEIAKSAARADFDSWLATRRADEQQWAIAAWERVTRLTYAA